ncbi:hypothetical protein SmJEL517_g02744 [Synchytrium microbalum]|uniref:ABC transporter domain-containing protein n=1 Tax=Synchytrium microbalum TaxID=1806994 RepID=A0A507C5P9_9FUNG|nr:uncharacterized protein SmJEL517_g02744 [Synchytrium microbalum]TPX34688.1 hypothetical protein SmJEL517_g02744 [Synchytrium microbalum]
MSPIQSEVFSVSLQPSKTKQFVALVRKDWRLKTREWLLTFVAVFVPLFQMSILLILQSALLKRPDSNPQPTQFPKLTTLCTSCVHVAYVNDSTTINSVITQLQSLILANEPTAVFQAFDSETSLRTYQVANTVVAGVAFTNVSSALTGGAGLSTYTIYANETVFTSGYATSRFTTLQLYVDRVLVNLARSAKGLAALPNPLNYTSSATGITYTYVAGALASSIAYLAPYYLAFSMQPISANVQIRLANEKHKGVKPFLILMGLDSTVYLFSACFSEFCFAIPTILLATLLLTVGNIIIYSSPLWTFLCLFLYLLSLLSQGALLSAFVYNPRVVSLSSNLFMAVNLVVYALGALYVWGRPAKLSLSWIMMLLPGVAFARGIDILQQSDLNLAGITLSNVSTTEMPKVLGMLTLDIVIWWFLAWYVQLRYPGMNGPGLSRTFFLSSEFWFGPKSDTTSNKEMPLSETVSPNIDPVDLSAIPQESRNIAALSHVVKVFTGSSDDEGQVKGGITRLIELFKAKDETRAIDDVSLSLNQGQIVGVLGHNGSGKTTLCNLLCGLMVPTSGSVFWKIQKPDGTYNILDTRNPLGLNVIRQNLGICTQKDVLFDSLTVHEHLELFAAVKGVNVDDLDAYLDALIADVGLEDNSSKRAAGLSGGQRRRLGVALAILGNPSLILFDEPTTGMDINATLHFWELLQVIKANKTIILTTHSMEEAEILSDRILVLSHGGIQTLGTTSFLKKRFGIGMHLVVDFKQDSESPIREVLAITNSHFPSSTISKSTANSVTFTLPPSDDTSKQMPALLKELGDGMRSGKINNVVGVGVGGTSLEDVFLNLRDAESHST